MQVTLDDMKEIFGEVKVVSGIRCWDMGTKKEILPPLAEPVCEIMKRDLAFICKGSDIVICTTPKALESSKGKRKCLLEEVLFCMRPDFDMSQSICDWEGWNYGRGDRGVSEQS
jgi:hypothetical protein